MSVPDDPFANASPPGSSGQNTRPPTLTVTTPAIGPNVGPSGSTSGTGTGHKTPRRVQWTADHIVSIEPPGSPSSTLDEAGFEELRTALERHKSKSGAHPRSSSRIIDRSEQERRRDEEIDLAEAEPDGEEDYDYRLDTGPYPATESVGSNAPSYETNPGDERDPLSSYPPSHVRMVHPSAQGHSLPPEESEGMAQDMRDQLAVFVDPGETDGMPSLLAPGADQAENAAAATALVKAHRSGRFGGFLRNRKKDASSLLKKGPHSAKGVSSAEEKGMNAFASRYPETAGAVEAQSDSAKPLGVNASALRALGGRSGMGAGGSTGGGVLASLLALYDNGQNDRSGQSTPASSRPASVIVSDDSSDEERERREQERRRKKEERKGGGWATHLVKPKPRYPPGQITLPPRPPSSVGSTRSGTPDQREQLSPTDSTFGAQHRSKSGSSLVSMGREGKDGRSSPNFVQQFKRAADRMGLDVDSRVDRPKAARSGGGVMGALMASTANITGAATPAGSTLVPAAKRSGYRLSRFTIGDPSEADANRRQPSSPPSRPASVAGGIIDRVSSHVSLDAAVKDTQDTSPSTGRTQVDAPTMEKSESGHGKAAKPNKPFSMRSFGSLTHLPLTPGGRGSHWLGNRSNPTSPAYSETNEKGGDYFGEKLSRASTFMTEDERRRKEWELEKKKRKKAKEKKKQQEIFIIQHVAAILARQQFILKLARAFMMFGSPSHRLEAQIQATARVLEINCQAVYFPGTCLISFGDEATHTSETKFLKQSTGLDLRNLLAVHHLYWKVVHDQISVEEASREIDKLMTSKPLYNVYETLAIGGLCSAFICCIAFYGSFIDALISIPLGVLLIGIQLLAAKNDLYSNVFEITVAVINSFLAAALASTKVFCFTAVMSSSIVLILPGFIVLSGSLELASRNITSGSVRIAYSILYSLLLGFGISLGVTLYQKITGLDVLNVSDYTCAATHYDGAPWYQQTPSEWWYFLIAPAYSFFLSLRQAQPIFAKEMPAMVLISCAGWASNHFSARAFPNRSDITSLVGSFVVGILGNVWGKFFQGTSFVVMLVGILFQLPSGLSNGGILSFAATTESDTSTTYSNGFTVAQQLVSISLGLTIGLFVAAVVVHPFGGGRRRGNGIFSF